MCGIIGVVNQRRLAAPDIYIGLFEMQHRGKESAGMVTQDRGKLYFPFSGMGEVPQVFSNERIENLKGGIGIGHVRYSTTGNSDESNVQPIIGNFRGLDFYIVHNGNLVNTNELREITRSRAGCSDTQVIADLISMSKNITFRPALIEVLKKLRGAFNLIIFFDREIYAIRDSLGFHPLQLGKRSEDWIVASESCVFDHLGAEFIRDINPGEMIIISKDCRVYQIWEKKISLKIDIFEYIYFLRPDSIVYNIRAWQARYWMGWFLADEYPINVDIVVPIPDSGNAAALGYYEHMLEKGYRLKYRPEALIRPHNIGRTFIEPIQKMREYYLNLKFNPQVEDIEGQQVVLVDDSIVRGNTIKRVDGLLKKAGAAKVSVVISSPPYIFPDFYGIDTYRFKDELIAKRHQGNIHAIAQECNLDFLGYLNLEFTIKAILKAQRKPTLTKDNFYTGPFTGEYPAGTGDFAIN